MVHSESRLSTRSTNSPPIYMCVCEYTCKKIAESGNPIQNFVVVAGMDRERRIMVAVDDGEESMHALSWCLKHVVSDGADSKDRLILLYVMLPGVVYTSMDGTGYLFSRDIMENMESYGKEMADSVLRRAKNACKNLRNVKVEAKVEKGEPGEVITAMTGKLGAHILVMGTHGYGVIKRALLGSVSNHCVQKAKCPVLVVKRPSQQL